jgi:hypothetical protein
VDEDARRVPEVLLVEVVPVPLLGVPGVMVGPGGERSIVSSRLLLPPHVCSVFSIRSRASKLL